MSVIDIGNVYAKRDKTESGAMAMALVLSGQKNEDKFGRSVWNCYILGENLLVASFYSQF
jgi:hypothetical protein